MERHEKQDNNLLKDLDEVILDYKYRELQIRKSYFDKLSEIEKVHRQQIETERNIILNSWRWRIGNFQVSTLIAIKDAFISLYRLISGKKFRIRSQEPGYNKTFSKSIVPGQEEVNQEDTNQLTLACIFDTFTYSCFRYEFNLLSPHPDNWKHLLRHHHIDAMFCESAWKGNNASWRFYIGNIGDLRKKGLQEFVSACRNMNIPTIFWNKEDPVHFDHFINDTRYFDYVFTSDAAIIPKYQEQLGHDKVYALPFAAQEKIDNPVRSEERKGSVCFAGTWYAAKYAERIIDMEMILNPAKEFGLEIYDRNFDATGYEKVMYGFPESYKPFIKGKLEYHEMIKAYKHYKVFLNINSVRYSPTMFSRRVFELLACGTPVISTYSEGIIKLLGEGTVLFVENEDDTTHHLDKLLNDEVFWWQQSLNGMRTVLENHTYRHRANEIALKTGLPQTVNKSVRFLLFCMINSQKGLQFIANQVNSQYYKHFKTILVLKSTNEELYEQDIKVLFQNEPVVCRDTETESTGQIMNGMLDWDYMAILKDTDFYGKNYLRDMALAVQYAGARALGKVACHVANGNGKPIMINKGEEYTYVSRLNPGSYVLRKDCIDPSILSDLLNNARLPATISEILAVDPWNFVANGSVSDINLLKLCEL